MGIDRTKTKSISSFYYSCSMSNSQFCLSSFTEINSLSDPQIKVPEATHDSLICAGTIPHFVLIVARIVSRLYKAKLSCHHIIDHHTIISS